MYRRAVASLKLDDDEKRVLDAAISTRASIKADKQFPGWQKKSDAYIKAGNKDGYLRFIRSIYKQVLPDSIEFETKKLGAKAAPAAKPAAKPPVPGQKQPAAAAPTGYTLVARMPDRSQINFDVTSYSMLEKNRAITNDGKRVTWK